MLKGTPLCPVHMPQGHKCTVTAWTAEIPLDVPLMTYVQIGFQERADGGDGAYNDPVAWPGVVLNEPSSPALREMRTWFSLPNGPKHLDCGVFVDGAGARNWIFFAYWLDHERFKSWSAHPRVAAPWNRLPGSFCGIWREVAVIPTERLETIQQAHREHASMRFFNPQVTEVHQYWGAARDRIPASTKDDFLSEFPGGELPEPVVRPTERLGVKVSPPGNVCHVRSAQDLMLAGDRHMKTYVERVEPSLREGLDYIRSNPVELGALSTRYIREVTATGEPLAKTCGQLFFLSMAHMERWAASHHTHLRILAQFNAMAERYGSEMGLALWHEVAVLPAGHLTAEYVGCHGGTGFLPYFADRQKTRPLAA